LSNYLFRNFNHLFQIRFDNNQNSAAFAAHWRNTGEHAVENWPNTQLVPKIGVSDLLALLSIWMQIPVFFIPICDKLTLISNRPASYRIVRCLSKSNLEHPRILPALILQPAVRN